MDEGVYTAFIPRIAYSFGEPSMIDAKFLSDYLRHCRAYLGTAA